MFKGKVVAFALMLVFATSVFAGDVDECKSTAGIYPCSKAQITICPQGDFEYFRTICGAPGSYVYIIALDASSNPVGGIPYTDYWMNSCDATKQLKLCISPFAADSLTGAADGKTTFSNGRIAGGGCNIGLSGFVPVSQGVWWAIQAKTLLVPPCPTSTKQCINLWVKSPDLTGDGGILDGWVNLNDLTPFGRTSI